MAIVKHATSKNMSYGDVLDYFSYKHKEDTEHGLYEPVLDQDGLMQERDNYAVACLTPTGQEAPPENWWLSCMQTNLAFGKNQEKKDRKQHQYIISHPEEDRPLMTMEDLLEEGKAFVRENLPGYDALIAVHRDTDNDHIHIAINSVRAVEREPRPWMMKNDDGSIRRSETCAGGKHQDSPEFRKHYNDWLLTYTREHGLTEKDNNAIAEQHKQERYGQRNQELAEAIREAAKTCVSFPSLVQQLEQEKIFLLRKGKDYCVLGPKNRNAVRLETLGIQAEEMPILRQELEQQSPQPQAQPKEFLIEKRKYIEWIQNRREKNNRRAEDALADAAVLITSKAHSKEEFQELRVLVRQTIYLERDLQTELDKVENLLERWQKYLDPKISPEERRSQDRFLRWCGCNPDSQEELQKLHTDQEVISLQMKEVSCVQDALKETTDQWRTYSEPILTVAETIARRDQLSHKLSVIRANRKKLGQIAYNCQKAADRRIYKQPYLEKAVHFRKLWHDKLLQEKAVKAQLRQAKREVRLARGRGERG